MAINKNITMKQFNGVDYDTLYPKTIASQIDDVYSKDEMSNLFLPKAGGSMGGILDMNGNRITNLPTPTSNSDPATKEYVDNHDNYLSDFNIPKTINNCIIANDSSNVYGTAIVTNYIGYSIVSVNITRSARNTYAPLLKSDYSHVLPGLTVSDSRYTMIHVNISTSSTSDYAIVSIDNVRIPVSSTGKMKYLFPFNFKI